MTVTAKVKKTAGYDDSLMVFRNGCVSEIIHIDRTFYGPEWCDKHDMIITETVDADGERFDIWKKGNELACAIPHREGA